MNNIIKTELDIIKTPGGNVLHAMKSSDQGFVGFKEAYFSEIESDEIKAWKKHKEMTLNLVVPIGLVKFVFIDDRKNTKGQIHQFILSKKNYCRLTVPPKFWMGFKGLSESKSLVLNLADFEHDPQEVDRKSLEEIDYDWSI